MLSIEPSESNDAWGMWLREPKRNGGDVYAEVYGSWDTMVDIDEGGYTKAKVNIGFVYATMNQLMVP